MAKNTNIELTKADTETIVTTFSDSNGDAFVITGYTFTFAVGSAEGLSDVLSKTGSSFTKTSNTASLELSVTDTNKTVGQYWYSISMVDSNSKKTTIAHGKCNITLERTGSENNLSVVVGTTTLDVDMFVAYGTQSGGSGGGITSIDTDTPTTLSGILKGASSTIEVATAGTDYVATDDARLTDARTPTTHTHSYEPANANIQSHISATTTAHGGIVASNDARLTDSRTPTSHPHGNISNAGAIGSTANLPILTGASGALTVGAFGTGATDFCAGNDSRLSNARTPTAHNQAVTTITNLNSSIGCHFGSGHTSGSVPTTGVYGPFRATFACTITGWAAYGDASGSAVCNIKVAGTSIVGTGNKPTLSSQQTATASVSGWTTTSISVGDLITYDLESVATCKLVGVELLVTRV